MKKLFKWVTSIFILSALLSACGGSSSSSNPTPPAPDTVVMNNSNGAVADGQTNVVLRPSLGIQFSSAVDTSTVNTSTVCVSTSNSCTSPVALTSFTANNADTAFSFAPVNLLQANTKYYLIVNGVKSATGTNVTNATFSFTTGSSTVPMVSIINPSNAGTNVSRSPSIQIQFSESMLNVNSSNVTLTALESNGTPVRISNIIGGANFSYTFSPESQLAEGTKYYVNVNGNVVSADGNENHLSPTSFFFTVGDTSNPTVTMTDPTNGETNVSKSQIVNLTFSESVVGVSESSLIVYESTNSTGVRRAYSITKSGNTYSLTFESQLLEQTTYYVSVGSPIKDLRGNALVNQTFSFTTGDFTNPTVTLTGDVLNNATNVNLQPIITLQFSEGVLGVESNVSIGQIGAGILPAESYTITKVNNSRYTISFNSELNEYTGYYLILNDNITDMSVDRNPLPQTSFTFTTANVSAPTVQINSPANGSTTKTTTPIITIQFSKAVNGILPNQNVKLYRDESRGELVPVTNVVAGANNTFEVQYSGPLDESITYSLVVGENNPSNKQIEDDNGSTLNRTEFRFTVGDLTDPTVSIRSPLDGATGVTRLPMIQLQFSESVTNFESNIQLIGPNGNISIATPVMGSGNIVTLYPQEQSAGVPLLQNNTLYTLYVKSGIVDGAGNNLVEKAFTFTTGTSSTVQSALVSPVNGQNPTGTSPVLLVRFSAGITGAGTPPTGFSLNNSATVTSVNGVGNNIYSVDYNNILANNSYTLSLSGVPSFYYGSVQSANYTFTTTDNLAPYVESSNPSYGATGQPRNLASFRITFSKPVAGVTSSNICLQESNFNTAGWQGCEPLNLTSGNRGDTSYTFTPINNTNFYPGNDVRIYIPASSGIYSVEPGTFGTLVAESTAVFFTVN